MKDWLKAAPCVPVVVAGLLTVTTAVLLMTVVLVVLTQPLALATRTE
jgi:hypothetical protein